MKFLLGTIAYNKHIQNIALSLHEIGALATFYTGFVDNYSSPLAKKLRGLLENAFPDVSLKLSRRRITSLPDAFIRKNWGWEFLRILSGSLAMDARVQDWFWEKSEHGLDRRCSRLLRGQQFDAFFGVEHGALFSILAARQLGKKSVVAFISPHHTFREKWVDTEYKKFPELFSPVVKKLLELGRIRDMRRDKEAELADVIHTNSKLTTQSLVDAGFPEKKIATVYLGAPPAISDARLPNSPYQPLRFMYAGPISVHKGTYYLLKAWQALNPGGSGELHLYGTPLLPKRYFKGFRDNFFMHHSVPQRELSIAYQQSSVLVFPTLCDGFGMVIFEALANGLPVITTPNAGAAEFIQDGKNGFLVPPADVSALVERMQWCLTHPKELLEMRRNALATANGWSWSDFRVELREQLSKILDIPLQSTE